MQSPETSKSVSLLLTLSLSPTPELVHPFCTVKSEFTAGCGSALHFFPSVGVRMTCLNWDSPLFNFCNPTAVRYPVIMLCTTLFCHQELLLGNTLWRGHYQGLNPPEWIRTGFTHFLFSKTRRIYPVQQTATPESACRQFLQSLPGAFSAGKQCPSVLSQDQNIENTQSISFHISLATTKDLC